jgi:hypothetical protein
MARCEVCGNEYDKPFVVRMDGQEHIFDSFECAIHRLALRLPCHRSRRRDRPCHLLLRPLRTTRRCPHVSGSRLKTGLLVSKELDAWKAKSNWLGIPFTRC